MSLIDHRTSIDPPVYARLDPGVSTPRPVPHGTQAELLVIQSWPKFPAYSSAGAARVDEAYGLRSSSGIRAALVFPCAIILRPTASRGCASPLFVRGTTRRLIRTRLVRRLLPLDALLSSVSAAIAQHARPRVPQDCPARALRFCFCAVRSAQQPLHAYTHQGPASASQTLTLRVALASNNMAGLEAKLLDISNPASANYAKWLSACTYSLVI
jgi:hypothetical protein